jgi:hypothetical protein
MKWRIYILFLTFTSSSWWVHVAVISLTYAGEDELKKEMRCTYRGKKADIASEKETYPHQ